MELHRDAPSLFGKYAPAYWEAGLPVIPIKFESKRPVPYAWQQYHDTMPDEQQQREWLATCDACNIGLPLGQQAGVVAIDIDTPNETITNLLLDILPPSPWVRKGKKGMVLLYKWHPEHKWFQIKDIKGNVIVELLGSKRQVVLPPSIHPDTKAAYVSNCELIDVINQIPVLTTEIEAILREALKDAKIELSISGHHKLVEWTPSGSRDVKMTAVAGMLAHAVIRGDRSLVEAVEEFKAINATQVERISGDEYDVDKGIQNLIRFLHRDVVEHGKALPKGWDHGLTDEARTALNLDFTEDDIQWDYEQVKAYLMDKFERDIDPAARTQAIEYAVKKIATNKSFNAIDEDRILNWIAQVNKETMGVTITSLRRLVREMSKGGLKGENHSEIANAVVKILKERHGLVAFYNHFLWKYTGSHWEKWDENEVFRTISNEYGHLPAARKANDHNGIFRIVKTLLPQTIVDIDRFAGVNFANGVLTPELKLIPHDHKYGFTYTLPFRYMPELSGRAHKWMHFLDRSWGEDEDYDEKVAGLQEAICATVFSMATDYERCFLLYGLPKTGKSQMLEVIANMMPDSARAACPPDQWHDKFAPATLLGAVFNSCGDLRDHKFIDGGMFKQIVSGEEMTGQFKGKPLFRFRPRCGHWMSSNHLVRTRDTSDAFNRRWLILSFNHPIKAEEVITNYGEQIVIEEREAIMAWAVEAIERLKLNRGYTLSKSHQEAIEDMANNNNSVRFFMKDSGKVKVDPAVRNGSKTSLHTSEQTLFNAYLNFCSVVAGVPHVGIRQFRMRMKELMFELHFRMETRESERGNENLYVGLTLADGRAA